MQINNNPSVQNFGMALRIDKGAKAVLNECCPELIESLQKAGKEMADTKFYHIEVDPQLNTKMVADKDAYFGIFKSDEFPNAFSTDKNVIILGNSYGVSRNVPYGETAPFFNVWDATGALCTAKDAERMAKVAKALDKAAVQKYAESLARLEAEDAQKAQVAKAVGSLLDEFGV